MKEADEACATNPTMMMRMIKMELTSISSFALHSEFFAPVIKVWQLNLMSRDDYH